MLFLLLFVTVAYAQGETVDPPVEAPTEIPAESPAEVPIEPPVQPPVEPPAENLEEQMEEIEKQVQIQVDNTMAICIALGITCEEEAASKLVEALNELVVIEPPSDTESSEEEAPQGDQDG